MIKKTFTGRVVSDKMKMTVVVSVEMPKTHPLYGKRVKNTKRLKAHNELSAKVGDLVVITESRPISKWTSFVVSEIVKE